MIITGAPVENLDFKEVDYWDELCVIMDWSRTHVYSTLHICWGAQAGLFHHHGIPKHPLPTKMSGIFRHRPLDPNHPSSGDLTNIFICPHSRYTSIEAEDIENKPGSSSSPCLKRRGLPSSPPGMPARFFVTGHCEYDRYTLAVEYHRDVLRGIHPLFPNLISPATTRGSPSDGMAQPREPAVFQLAELLCIPTDAV